MAKSKRVKPQNLVKLSNLSEIDDALFEIAQLRTKLKLIDAEAEEQINKIKERAAKQAESIKNRIEQLANGIFAYAEYNKDELFEKKKTIELNFGFIGYRKSTKISVKKTTVEKLKEMGMLEHIIVKESPNKETLAQLPDEILKQVDAKRVVEDNFWYEVKEEEITQNAAKQVA